MSRARRGFTLIESCAAAALLGAAFVAAVSLLSAVARQRQAAVLHARAIVAADNLLERLTYIPYEEITPGRADELRQASKIAEILPNGVVAMEIAGEAGSPPGKRIEVEVTWRTAGKGQPARHCLATWVYRAEETK